MRESAITVCSQFTKAHSSIQSSCIQLYLPLSLLPPLSFSLPSFSLTSLQPITFSPTVPKQRHPGKWDCETPPLCYWPLLTPSSVVTPLSSVLCSSLTACGFGVTRVLITACPLCSSAMECLRRTRGASSGRKAGVWTQQDQGRAAPLCPGE